jgi:hypothetical protein
MTVWICQCLCPDRHCIMAAVCEAETETEADTAVRAPLRRTLQELLQNRTVNPTCALCGAHRATWRFELGRTRFATMEDAGPELAELQAQNLATNLAFGDLHKTRPN